MSELKAYMARERAAIAPFVKIYEQHREELLKIHRGKTVLIGPDREVRIHDSHVLALEAGWQLFGERHFFVHEVGQEDRPDHSFLPVVKYS